MGRPKNLVYKSKLSSHPFYVTASEPLPKFNKLWLKILIKEITLNRNTNNTYIDKSNVKE